MSRPYKLPEVLHGLLKERNISQFKLAMNISTGQKSVSDWIKGRCMPNVISLMELSEELGVSIDYLIYGEDK